MKKSKGPHQCGGGVNVGVLDIDSFGTAVKKIAHTPLGPARRVMGSGSDVVCEGVRERESKDTALSAVPTVTVGMGMNGSGNGSMFCKDVMLEAINGIGGIANVSVEGEGNGSPPLSTGLCAFLCCVSQCLTECMCVFTRVFARVFV